MNNKTNIEEDIKIVESYLEQQDRKFVSEYRLETLQAIENILADRNNIAKQYNNLIFKIEEKIKENKEYLQHANTMYEYTEKDLINTIIETLQEILDIE